MTALSLQLPLFMGKTSANRPRVAISACLAGSAVRYDGGDKKLALATLLQQQLELVPVCPEVGAGMSVPRPPIQLVYHNGSVHALGRDDAHLDVTTALEAYRQDSLLHLKERLCGYIWKSRSPSCGLNTTPLFNGEGEQLRLTSGMQADYFRRQLPWLQMVDEQQLADADECRQFIRRCEIFADVRDSCSAPEILKGATQGLLPDLHRHYSPVTEQMPAPCQRQLHDALLNDDPHCYWQRFGFGLQSLRQ